MAQSIVFPTHEWKAQSPYLYLQSAGSTGADGSTFGAHVRWMLLRNLGDTHLPKGNNAVTSINFNRADDFVHLYRSRYTNRYPTIIDFSVPAGVVNDAQKFWIYVITATDTVVYIHFRDAGKYDSVRASVDPATQPLQFLQQYCPSLLEAEVKDKLFFAAEFNVARTSTTRLRAEALTVESNVPLASAFVSCRKEYTDVDWCEPRSGGSGGPPGPGGPSKRTMQKMAQDTPTVILPWCCMGTNFFADGSFEQSQDTLTYETEYTFNGPPEPGSLFVRRNAAEIREDWVGTAHSGEVFLAVDGSKESNQFVLRHVIEVTPGTIYCFGGWLSRLYNHDEPIIIEVRLEGSDGTVRSYYRTIPVVVSMWEQFVFSWHSGDSSNVIVEIFTWSTLVTGNDFGIDDLWFCMSRDQTGLLWCCAGYNFLLDGGFEDSNDLLAYETDYEFNRPPAPGVVFTTQNAAEIREDWSGVSRTGEVFLLVDGSADADKSILRYRYEVTANTFYCFGGWLMSVYHHEHPVLIRFRLTASDGTVQWFHQPLSTMVAQWQEFVFSWFSGESTWFTMDIFLGAPLQYAYFGFDDLWFCIGSGPGSGTGGASCCKGPNMLQDGGFEQSTGELRHETDYEFNVPPHSGVINSTNDASGLHPAWVGRPHTGNVFLAVDGSVDHDQAVLRYEFDVMENTLYCFSGWLTNLNTNGKSIQLEIRFTWADGRVEKCFHTIPPGAGIWNPFSCLQHSGSSTKVGVEIFVVSPADEDNDFGIDDLWFCLGTESGGSGNPSCCEGNSVLEDGGFENSRDKLTHETDYEFNGPPHPGIVNVTSNASDLEPSWQGRPHRGGVFLAVDGSDNPDQAVLRFHFQVTPWTTYCFGGWLSSLHESNEDIVLEFRFAGSDGTNQSSTYTIPADPVGAWNQFMFTWNSGAATNVDIEIVLLSLGKGENDFGIDDLWFCTGKEVVDTCRPRIMSENIRSVRFDVENGYPRGLEIETYEDYITGASWDDLAQGALTDQDSTAFSWLEPTTNAVHNHWKKFNDNARLNLLNYQDRWTRTMGLKYGVQQYISLSNWDPLAMTILTGDVYPQDGTMETSMLDMLRMVSLDFHVARMFGLGYLDENIADDEDEYIYLGIYNTEGPLDDTSESRPVRHYYMGVPTRPIDHRLPDTPLLKPVTYGITVDNGEPTPTWLTNTQGYTPDGLSRYVNVFVQSEVDTSVLGPFFNPSDIFCAVDKTASLFYGVEYRKLGEGSWRKPEIAHEDVYKDMDVPDQFETMPLSSNPDPTQPLLRHEEKENGVHEYSGYGINWFSRASALGNIVATNATLIKKANRLLPPSNLAVQLIQSESPLMLTTSAEQAMLAGIPGADKTLVRVTFDYFHTHDTNYGFANKVQLVFRPAMPRNVVGAIKSVIDDPSNSQNAILRTEDYIVNSLGTTITPTLSATYYPNFIGGVVSCQQKNYIIVSVGAGAVGEGPVFTVKKIVQGNASDPGSTGSFITVQEYTAPELDPSSSEQVMFMAVENMADIVSWGTPNPLTKEITIGDSTWTNHTETYVQDGDTITTALRGVWATATVTHTPTAAVQGLYKITFQTYQLPHHPQYADPDSVEWYKGVVRIAKASDAGGRKKVLEVIKVENLATGSPLILHAIDNTYVVGDQIITGTPVTVNYYPGYKVYLHADVPKNFTASTILPAAGEGNRKTWLGARSRDTVEGYFSAVGVPGPIIAMEFIEPLPPEQPSGSEYATRPDFYYKSSYTFRINFAHKPFAAAMYRANEEAILRAIYSDATYKLVRQELDALGEDDPYFADRWKNLLSFDYIYNVPGHPYYDPTGSNTNGTFRKFPREDGYAFPNPNKGGALNGSAPGSILAALKDAINGAFTPLTELPMMYDYINGPTYIPVPKPQNVRNGQGTLLTPGDSGFDIAPMAKKTGNGFEIQFTDFTLDGTGNNIFFYFGREIGNRGRLGDPGPAFGPIRLINTRPPDAPGVKKVYVQEPNALDEIGPAVRFEINNYPDVQKVERMLIYRATDATSALTVRTMDLVKTVDFIDTEQLDSLSIMLEDNFEDGFVPYGDPLFYRIIALRRITNPEGETEWAPSQPSKLLLTTVIDTVNPEAPEISFTSTGFTGSPVQITGVVLSWPVTTYNGTYYLEKMNSAGNWVTIYRVKTNSNVTVNLAATDLGTNILPKENEDDSWPIYNRFRVRVENSSGLFSLTDKVLTI